MFVLSLDNFWGFLMKGLAVSYRDVLLSSAHMTVHLPGSCGMLHGTLLLGAGTPIYLQPWQTHCYAPLRLELNQHLGCWLISVPASSCWHPAHEVAASPASWLAVHEFYSCTLTSLVSSILGAFDWLHRYPSARLNMVFNSDISQKHPGCPMDAYVPRPAMDLLLAKFCTEVPLGLLPLWKKCEI